MMSLARIGRVVPSLSVQVPVSRSATAALDRGDLFGRDLRVALVRHRHPERPRLGEARAAHGLPGGVGVAVQPPLIDLIRDEAADLGMHPARDGQEDAAVRRHGRVVAQHPVEAGEVRGFGMRALDHLRQLARIADQHDVARGPSHGDHVGEAHLSRLVDEEPVEGLLDSRRGRRRRPCRRRHARAASAASSLLVVRRDPGNPSG